MTVTVRTAIDSQQLAADVMEVQSAVSTLQTLVSGLSAPELGFVDGVVAGTAAVGKAVVLTTGKVIDTIDITAPKIGGVAVSSTAAEINTLAAVTAGTAAASKAAVLDASKGLAGVGLITTDRGVSSGTANKVGGMAFSDVAASDTVTAVASNNAFVTFAQTYSLPASSLTQGARLRIRAMVSVADASGADTLTCNIRLGGTSLIASTAVDPSTTSDHHVLEFDVIARAAPGATASCVGYGKWFTNTAGTNANKTAILAATNFATNGALVVDIQAKWSSNTASTTARLEMLNVEIV